MNIVIMSWYKKAQTEIEFSKDYPYGSYLRFDIIKNKKSIGHLSYLYKDNIIYIDMIQITDKTERRKGYASLAIKYLMNRYNTNHVTGTEDGLTEEGKKLFNNMGLL